MSRNQRRRNLAVGPKLKVLLKFIFFLFALLMINSVYLSVITFIEWLTDKSLQDQTYIFMFLTHLVLGLLLIVPFIIYGFIHIGNTRHRKNKRAIKAGYALFIISIVLLISGLLLTRGIPVVELKNVQLRNITYWIHVILPFVAIWLFIMHRLAGPKLSWKAFKVTVLLTVALMLIMVWLQQATFFPKTVEHDEMNPLFAPSFSQTHTNNYIPAKDLDNNKYCQSCHQDVHEGWMNSVHKVSSFNNQSYSFAVNNTREFLKKRDGHHKESRFCATCHDPVILFSGEFDKEKDFTDTEIGQAGITCTVCHAISDVNSIKGNGSYTLTIPEQYPFTSSQLPFLQWVNQTLVKAKPDFHKASYLKPLHKSAEFCSTCHKVSIPESFNDYKWLRGQNHYDSFYLSGVSGHAVASFYYPPKAVTNCASCHMPLQESDDFGAITETITGKSQVHSHYFQAANSGIRYLNDLKSDPNSHLLKDSLTVDVFGIKKDGDITGELIAPLSDESIEISSGQKYLLETVIKTVKLGHAFTQGTGDSNQVWVELNVYHDDKLIAMSGGMNEEGFVDDWSYFINVYMLDNQGNRIDRRNVEDIFTPLYNHSIPPGAGAVVHYELDLPEQLTGEITIEAKVLYRKFDTTYYRLFTDDEKRSNDLPIVTLAADTQKIIVKENPDNSISFETKDWKRWNDYGIGLLRKQSYKQAEEAFMNVAKLGKAEGWVNLTRAYIQQGRLTEARDAINKASQIEDFRYTWQLAYFSGIIDFQNGFIEKALDEFSQVYRSEFKNAQDANFDFSKDYRFVTMYAQTVFQRSKLLKEAEKEEYLKKSLKLFFEVLDLNPEWADAHYGLSQVYAALGDVENSQLHQSFHNKYKADDNSKDKVIAKARANNAAADHAAEAIAIYKLDKLQNMIPVIQYITKNNITTE
ncbi:MAG: multiheme c-type cytochrome [Marinicellaceae bacterium]